jgi:hypothetical protein
MLLFIVASCVLSEASWTSKENGAAPLAKTIGLASLVVGNLNPSARNPGLELFCTSLYDNPGGFCNYFAPGVPPENFKVNVNVTASGIK